MVTASPALAALPPQKHLGTVLCPIVRADLWLPQRGAKPWWLTIRAIHFLQNAVCWQSARRPIRSGGSKPNPNGWLAGRCQLYAKHLSTENSSLFLSM